MIARSVGVAALLSVVALGASEEALARGCSERSDIVGEEHCTHYGADWSAEESFALGVEFLFGPEWFDPKGHSESGSFGKNQAGSFSYLGNRVGHSLSAWFLGVRPYYAFLPWLYAGVEARFGIGHNQMPATDVDGYQVFPADGAINSYAFHGGAFIGLRAPLGYLSLRLETLLGGGFVGVTQAASGMGGLRNANVAMYAWDVEPRLFADVWVTPGMTVSVYGGTNLLSLKDFSGGVMFGFHGRKYDGAFFR